MTEVEKLLVDYISMLTMELNDVVGIASVRGWKSKRYEKGVTDRKELKDHGIDIDMEIESRR